MASSTPGTEDVGAARVRRGDALDDRAQRDDAGDVDGVEGLALVLHAGQVDDDVRALDADVGLGDAAVLELVADQVADDEQVVAAGPGLGGQDDRDAALQVEAEGRGVARARG